jgi:hypothetical protein
VRDLLRILSATPDGDLTKIGISLAMLHLFAWVKVAITLPSSAR